MKYTKGDKVVIIHYASDEFNLDGDMDEWCGDTMTIDSIGKINIGGIRTKEYYRMKEDGGLWYWYDEMIDHDKTLRSKTIGVTDLKPYVFYNEVTTHSESYTFQITSDGDLIYKMKGPGETWHTKEMPLSKFLEYRFVELEYKFPSEGDIFYTLEKIGSFTNNIGEYKWVCSQPQIQLLAAGNVFKSKRDAEEMEDKLIKDMVQYKKTLDTP